MWERMLIGVSHAPIPSVCGPVHRITIVVPHVQNQLYNWEKFANFNELYNMNELYFLIISIRLVRE